MGSMPLGSTVTGWSGLSLREYPIDDRLEGLSIMSTVPSGMPRQRSGRAGR